MSCTSLQNQSILEMGLKDLWEKLEKDAIFLEILPQHPTDKMRTRDRIYDNGIVVLPPDNSSSICSKNPVL